MLKTALLALALVPSAEARKRRLSHTEDLLTWEDVEVTRSGFGVLSAAHSAGRRLSEGLVEREKITVSFAGSRSDAVELDLDRSQAADLFAPTYKEFVLGEDGEFAVERAGPPQCLYKGTATRVRGGRSAAGWVTASLCAPGKVSAIVRYDGGETQEIGWDELTKRHVSFDPTKDTKDLDKEARCGVDQAFIDQQAFRWGDPVHRHLTAHGHEAHEDHEAHEAHEDHEAHEGHDHHDHHGHDHGVRFAFEDGLEDGHDHGHGRRLGMANEHCQGGEEKTVSVVLINDAARYTEFGPIAVEDDAAAIYSHVKDIYGGGTGVPGIFDGSSFDCKINMQLVGQFSFRQNPGEVKFKGPKSGCDKCSSNFCFEGEVSSYCLLESLTMYLGAKQKQMEGLVGAKIDNMMMLSSEDFNGGVVGLAWVGRMCAVPTAKAYAWDYFFSTGINEANFASPLKIGSIVAHETGHNWGMYHDVPDEGDPAGYLMGTTLASSPKGKNLQFSEKSKKAASTYLKDDYGDVTDKCIDDGDGGADWDGPVCGDGVVDHGEDCDPGFDATDGCCDTATCLLLEGCECAASEDCCSNDGKILAAGTPCRAQANSCDIAEECSGVFGWCPPDLSHAHGTPCVDDSTHDKNDKIAGTCYMSQCRTWSDDYCEATGEYLCESFNPTSMCAY